MSNICIFKWISYAYLKSKFHVYLFEYITSLLFVLRDSTILFYASNWNWLNHFYQYFGFKNSHSYYFACQIVLPIKCPLWTNVNYFGYKTVNVTFTSFTKLFLILSIYFGIREFRNQFDCANILHDKLLWD